MRGALEDVTVLSFAQIAQGPLAAQMLGDLGAEVIKLERPGGEWMRKWAMANTFLEGESTSFLSLNRNKRSVEVDLKDESHRNVVYELVDEADVIIENFRPGVMERLGFGYEELSEQNPELVYASATGYGTSGPYVDKPGQDLLVQAESGLMSITGSREDLPTAQATPMIDFFTGTYMAFSILAALHHRDQSGQGQKVETNLFNAAIAMQAQELTLVSNTDEKVERGREGIGHVFHQAPYGVYETADGHIAMSLTPPWELGEILDDTDLAAIDSWETAYEERDEIYTILSDILINETTDHWTEIFNEHDVWCSRVRDLEEIENHPQIDANEMLPTIDHPSAGEVTVPGFPAQFSETPATIRRHPPLVGEHTDEVLEEYGLSLHTTKRESGD